MNVEIITSAHNPKIKLLGELSSKSSERRKRGLFVVEGRRELEHCISEGYEIDSLFALDGVDIPPYKCDKLFKVSAEVYEKIAYRGSTEGLIGEVRERSRTLEDLHPGDNPLIIVLESVEKPGNLGAILRSADAAGADAVIVCDPLTDLYNPNLIRASIGSIFTVPTATCSSSEAIDFLKSRDIRILTAQLQDSSLYYNTPMTGGTAIVMGTESTGLSEIWRTAADAHIRIPMLGRMDSLNVSVSAAILLFEAVRQRNA